MNTSRDLPPLNALRAFEAAARLESMSAAAKELHVTHGAVSRQIRALEEQLGVALFTREGRGIRLTDDGALLSDACSDAFGRIRRACRDIRPRQRNAPFVLACPGSLLARWFIPRLDRLNSDLPDLHLQLLPVEGDNDIQRADVDATLCFAEPPWPAGVRVVELAPERIGPILSPQHPRFATLSRAPREALLDEPLLHTESRPQAWPQWATANGLDASKLNLGQGFAHLYYLLEAAGAGLGVAIAPQQLVADELASGRLAAPWGFIETTARLVLWLPESGHDRRGQALSEWLQAASSGSR